MEFAGCRHGQADALYKRAISLHQKHSWHCTATPVITSTVARRICPTTVSVARLYALFSVIDAAAGIMFSGCPSISVCACVFSEQLAVDFQFCFWSVLLLVFFYFFVFISVLCEKLSWLLSAFEHTHKNRLSCRIIFQRNTYIHTNSFSAKNREDESEALQCLGGDSVLGWASQQKKCWVT